MKKISLILVALGTILAACDLQPKITALPDTVGDFITARYPALLADPNTQPEIYNSAATDYGVYASPELYGTGASTDDYVLYSSVDDYIVPPDDVNKPVTESEPSNTIMQNQNPKMRYNQILMMCWLSEPSPHKTPKKSRHRWNRHLKWMRRGATQTTH